MARKSKTKKHGSGDRPEMRDNASPSAPPIEEEYKVGPGRPPKEYWFKPGQSGNPKGAKRKKPSLIPDLKELLQRAFNQKVKVTQGERQRLITMWDAGMQQLAVQFAKGDRNARRDAFWIIEKLGPEFLIPEKALDETLSTDRQAILNDYVEQQTQQTASSAPTPVLAPPELLDDDASDEADGK